MNLREHAKRLRAMKQGGKHESFADLIGLDISNLFVLLMVARSKDARREIPAAEYTAPRNLSPRERVN